MNPHNVTVCMHAYILKCQNKQLIVYVHSLFQIPVLIFLLNFDGYNINKELFIYFNCLQIYAYINAYNG